MVVPEKFFRVKLEFDTPPPAFPGSSKYVIVVKPDECKTVHDLEVYVIRKFGYSKGAIASLSIEGFCLPSTEDICILCNNDHVNVTVMQEVSRKKSRKRKIGKDEKGVEGEKEPSNNCNISALKKVKVDSMQKSDKKSKVTNSKSIKSKLNGVKVHNRVVARKRKLSDQNLSNSSSSSEANFSPKASLSHAKRIVGNDDQKHQHIITRPADPKKSKINLNKPEKVNTTSSGVCSMHSSETSSNESAEEQRLGIKQNILPKDPPSIKPVNTAAVWSGVHSKLSSKNNSSESEKQSIATSISLSTIASDQVVSHPKNKAKPAAIPKCQAVDKEPKNRLTNGTISSTLKMSREHCEASSSVQKSNHPETEIPTKKKCKSKKIVSNPSKSHITFDSSSASDTECEQQKLVDVSAPAPNRKDLSSWLDTAKACIKKPKQTWSTKPSRDPGTSTNLSSIYANPCVSDETKDEPPDQGAIVDCPHRNYSSLLPSTWPPRVGDIIAYKILEMSENYTPVISDYKEVKVEKVFSAQNSPIGVNSVHGKLLWPRTPITRKGGRFEMVYEEDEKVEPSDSSIVTLEWQTLCEPKRVE